MDTMDIRYFCRVYEEGGINQAAKQLFISPQGLSRVISKLEQEFGTTLFERSAKGMHPTESGIYLYDNCRELLEKLENVEVGIRRIEKRSRELELGFACGVLNVFPFERLERFKQQNGNFQVQWEEAENDEIMERLYRGSIDVGFIIGSINRPDIYSKEVYSQKLVALVYEGHPYYEREQLSVGDLMGEPLITLNEKFFCYHSFVSRCKDFNFVPLIKIKTMESKLIYRFCREGMGIGIDINIHKDELRMDGIRRIELYDSLPWRISVACREARKEEIGIKSLIEALRP